MYHPASAAAKAPAAAAAAALPMLRYRHVCDAMARRDAGGRCPMRCRAHPAGCGRTARRPTSLRVGSASAVRTTAPQPGGGQMLVARQPFAREVLPGSARMRCGSWSMASTWQSASCSRWVVLPPGAAQASRIRSPARGASSARCQLRARVLHGERSLRRSRESRSTGTARSSTRADSPTARCGSCASLRDSGWRAACDERSATAPAPAP